MSEELPFAGHPTLGTAWYLRQQSSADEIVLDLKVGKIPVRFEQRDGRLFGEMRQAEPQFGPMHSHAEVAQVLGVEISELDESLPIQTVSTGMPFTMVPFRSLATLQKPQVGWQPDGAYLATIGSRWILLFRLPRNRRAQGHPACAHDFLQRRRSCNGSAGGCCTAWAVKHGVLAPSSKDMIEQGIETQPSEFYLHSRSEIRRRRHQRARRRQRGAGD